MRYKIYKDSKLFKVVKLSEDKLLNRLLELEIQYINNKISFVKCL